MWQKIEQALFIVVIIHFPGEVISSSRYQSYECFAQSSWRHSASRVSTSPCKIVNSSVEFSACKRIFWTKCVPGCKSRLFTPSLTRDQNESTYQQKYNDRKRKHLEMSYTQHNKKQNKEQRKNYSRLSNQIKTVGYEICFPSPLISLLSFFFNSELNVRFIL